MIAIANRVFDICTSAANKPIRNSSAMTSQSLKVKIPPEREHQPTSTAIHIAKQNVSTGLLPSRSNREPRNHKLLKPPRKDIDVSTSIFPSAIPPSTFKNATVNAVIPPYATE